MAYFMAIPNPDAGHRCNTCRAIFSSVEKVKEHYRGDWHIFNSKRRAHEMEPLSKAEFKAINNSSSKISISSSPKGNKKVENIVSKEKSSSVVKKSSSATSSSNPLNNNEEEPSSLLSWGGISADTTDELRQIALQMGVGKDRVDSIVSMAVERQEKEQERNMKRREAFLQLESAMQSTVGGPKSTTDSNDEILNDEEDEEDEEEPPLVAPNVSIFDDHVCENSEECVSYMEKEFGFFIPDRDCLIDLDGMLVYLGEKVKMGGFCLYCQKQLKAGKSAQAHMISKSHCKIAYEEDVDMDEFEDFYDYTKNNQDELDEDGNPIDKSATVLSTGELLMPSGKIIGHKALRIYYKAYYSPEDRRPSVMAAQREELVKLGWQVGENYTEDNVVAMPDMQVMSLLVAARKNRIRELAYQQRAQQKDLMREKRKDHVVKQSKLQSNVQRTQIIRDYHGMLQ